MKRFLNRWSVLVLCARSPMWRSQIWTGSSNNFQKLRKRKFIWTSYIWTVRISGADWVSSDSGISMTVTYNKTRFTIRRHRRLIVKRSRKVKDSLAGEKSSCYSTSRTQVHVSFVNKVAQLLFVVARGEIDLLLAEYSRFNLLIDDTQVVEWVLKAKKRCKIYILQQPANYGSQNILHNQNEIVTQLKTGLLGFHKL